MLRKNIISCFLFIIISILSFLLFKSATANLKHIDGTEIKSYEAYIVSIWFGIIGILIYKLFAPELGANQDKFNESDLPFGAF